MPSSSILTKSMALLDLIAATPEPMTLAEVVERSGLPKSSAHRLLVLLRDENALSYDADRQTYTPGSRLMRWGVQTQGQHSLARLALPQMRTLCRDTGMRVALSVLDGHSALYIQTSETGAPFRLAPRIGQHSPLHASAAGKVFLAGMDDRALARFLSDCELEQCTEFTIINADALAQEISTARTEGYAITAREEHRQTCGLACPILDTDNRTMAALSLWNLGDLTLLETLKGHLPALRTAASEIRQSIGHAAQSHSP